MKVDFSSVLIDIRTKEPIKETPEKNFTLSAVCCTALLNTYQDEQNLSGAEKFRRFKIASKAADGGEQDLSVEDITELKKLIAKAYGPMIVGQAWEMLDPEPKPPAQAVN